MNGILNRCLVLGPARHCLSNTKSKPRGRAKLLLSQLASSPNANSPISSTNGFNCKLMTATIIDGKSISRAIQKEIGKTAQQFFDETGVKPKLAAVLVGEDPASQVYVRNKERACKRANIESELFRLPDSSTTREVIQLVQKLNDDSGVHGILVQLPLPDGVDAVEVLDTILPEKDVDAFHPQNVGMLSQGRPRFLPCTPFGIVHLLARSGIETTGKNVCIVGRSDIVGKPMALMLAQRDSALGPEYANATVSLCHSRTKDLVSHLSLIHI